MTKDYKFIALWLLSTLLITACSNDGAVGNDVTKPNEEAKEIGFNINDWKVMQGVPRRAHTYDGLSSLQSETDGFRCFIYNQNAITPYNVSGGSVVKWNSSTSQWEFQDGKHYWPISGSLDFFAYMPASKPTYITSGPTYSATSETHDVTFTCTLTNSLNDQGNSVKEFIYALTLDQDKAGTNSSTQPNPGQVALTFQHPFARIYFKRGTIKKNDVSVESNVVWISRVTLKNINKTGTYTYNNGTPQWSSLNNAASFSLTGANVPADGNGPYLVVPQSFSSTDNFEVGLSYIDGWGNIQTQVFETSVSTTWQSGYSYTYIISGNISAGGGGGGGGITVDQTKFTEQW